MLPIPLLLLRRPSLHESHGGDLAPGPGPPRLRVRRQFYLSDLSLTPGHPHGATRQTHAPLLYHWCSTGGGSACQHPSEDSHLGEPPGGVGPPSFEVAAHVTGAGKTVDAQA